MIDLREHATRQWERNREHRAQLETVRRFLAAFAFGIAATALVVMIIETAAQRAAAPTTSAISRGLME
jgi:hypothetical protein